ncbi:MAG: glycosyltransferase [Desulfovibrio sp.]|jgi:glycosyltransferase involved in cell wall biosynthesis|nr:glycosyltransferase [Desulfovibrio sp.]
MDANILTVVICTYNRAEVLAECLESLTRQTISTATFSVLVVDNNSTDRTRETVDSFLPKLSLRYVREEKQGIAQARNRALRETHSLWSACLDDDAKARPDWVAVALETIGKGDFDCFGGPYYAWHSSAPPPDWLPENYGAWEASQGYGPFVDDKTYIPGANCAFKTDLALTVGGFPVHLGHEGEKCAYGEETELFRNMRAAGLRLGYVPAMKVDHRVLPYKYNLAWQMKSSCALGYAEAHNSHFKNHGLRMLKDFFRLLRQGFVFCGLALCLPLRGFEAKAKRKAVKKLLSLCRTCGLLRGSASCLRLSQ